ncbi:Protein SUL-1 [Aphelenchoides avenae]|nr:Protein SUL-1 [Aphelenchus avenae]
MNYIEDSALSHPDKPFLAVLSFPAPHGPEDPAPQFTDLFDGIETHRTDAWNYAPNPDKQWLLQHTGKMEPVHVVFTDLLHRRRLQTLQSVDDAVHRTIALLRSLNELQNTFIIYTSDHGYHLGQFGLVKGKNMPYEFDIKVPFFVRGPGIPRGMEISSIVSNIDIAPTIVDMAGAEVPRDMDGRSILQLVKTMKDANRAASDEQAILAPRGTWRQTLLIERGKMPKLKKIRDRFLRQKARYNKELRISVECSKLSYQSDCVPGQQWKCVKNALDRWRLFKCRYNAASSKCECDSDEHSQARRRRHAVDDTYGDKEILDSGEWFQGVFDSAEDAHDDDKRMKRSRQKRQLDVAAGLSADDALCKLRNFTFCHHQEASSGRDWQKRKQKVDNRIEILRRKLSAYKDIRKAMRKEKPKVQLIEPIEEPKCSCKNQRHPLLADETSLPEESLAVPTRLSRRNGTRSMRKLRDRQPSNCSSPQMNCFTHSAEHWKTPPFWPEEYGEFCFCQNTNNNTYWCLRTVNETHNFLYCEFVTEFVSYYDLNADPYQLTNIVYSLELLVLEQLSHQLRKLRSCRTAEECEHYSSADWHLPFRPRSLQEASDDP